MLQPYYTEKFRIEVRLLYKNGEETRQQWIFQDEKQTTRLVAVFTSDGTEAEQESIVPDADPEDTAEEKTAPAKKYPVGFVELYNEDGLVSAEHLFSKNGEETVTDYTYSKQVLLKSEGQRILLNENGLREKQKIFSDMYRYNRAGGLRSVERIYAGGTVNSAPPVRISFPHLILNEAANANFVSPGLAYGTEFLDDVLSAEGVKVVYTIDERGRILTETRQDAEGKVVGELSNTWSGERLVKVSWREGDDERITEYDYDEKGDRITERNFHNKVLERVVRKEGKREVEELYMKGSIILRAFWEDGRKISEERVRK
jgi:hypothetical protein